jgi:hypothetical protein
MHIGLYCTVPAFCQVLMRLEFSRHIFEKYSNIKFHANPSSGSRVVSRDQTDGRTEIDWLTDRLTDMANLIVAFTILWIRLKCTPDFKYSAARYVQRCPLRTVLPTTYSAARYVQRCPLRTALPATYRAARYVQCCPLCTVLPATYSAAHYVQDCPLLLPHFH